MRTIQEKLVAYLEQQLLSVIELPSSCQLIQTVINESGTDMTLGVFVEFEVLFFVKLHFLDTRVLMTCPAWHGRGMTKLVLAAENTEYKFTNLDIANLGASFVETCKAAAPTE